MAKPYPNQFITTVLKISLERCSSNHSVVLCSGLFEGFGHWIHMQRSEVLSGINTLTLLLFRAMLLHEFVAKLYQNQFITTMWKINLERCSSNYSIVFCSELFEGFGH